MGLPQVILYFTDTTEKASSLRGTTASAHCSGSAKQGHVTVAYNAAKMSYSELERSRNLLMARWLTLALRHAPYAAVGTMRAAQWRAPRRSCAAAAH